jgi:hypothetical protein
VNGAAPRSGWVFVARLDLDEAGGGVVDIFCAPVRSRSGRTKKDGSHGEPVLEISANKALKEVQHRYKTCIRCGSRCLGRMCRGARSSINRGRPKSETGRGHLAVPQFKAAAEEASRILAQAETQWRLVEARRREIEDEERRLKKRAAELAAKEAQVQEPYEKVCDAQVENFQRAGELIDEGGRIGIARQKMEAKETAILERARDVEAKDNQARLREGAIAGKERGIGQRRSKVAAIMNYQKASEAGLVKFGCGELSTAEDIDGLHPWRQRRGAWQ